MNEKRGLFECVANVSEGRDHAAIGALASSCGAALLDVHSDRDHHRSVFTLGGSLATVEHGIRRLAEACAARLDIRTHTGVHPRLGVLDVAPFVALDPGEAPDAVEAAHRFAGWLGGTLAVPSFLYGEADPEGRSLPLLRREAFVERPPDAGPGAPHETMGATAVGARPPLVAVNCVLASSRLELAQGIAAAVRESSGGLRGVRALGFALESRGRSQVSMNLVDLDVTGVEAACTTVRERARSAGDEVTEIELVGLLPRDELERCSAEFRSWAELGADQTVEARLEARTG